MHIYIYDAEAGHKGSETRQMNEKKKTKENHLVYLEGSQMITNNTQCTQRR